MFETVLAADATTLLEDATGIHAGLFLLRVLVGLLFAAHGFQKLFGWFGGGGHDATAGWFDSLGFAGHLAAWMAGATEAVAGLGIAVGLLTPVAAAGMIGVMVVAAVINHASKGFWSAGNGWEYNLVLMIIAGSLAFTGPGAWSLDHALGLDLAGVGAGIAAVAVGVGAGFAQLATRRDRS